MVKILLASLLLVVTADACDPGALSWPVQLGADAGECPDGYAHIDNVEDCQAAAAVLGDDLIEGTWDDASHVKSCFSEASQRIYWNHNDAGTIQNNAVHSGPVCQRVCPTPSAAPALYDNTSAGTAGHSSDNMLPPAWCNSTSFRTCDDILAAGCAAGSGRYALQLGSRVEEAWCDMDTLGGGWTLFARVFERNEAARYIFDTLRNGWQYDQNTFMNVAGETFRELMIRRHDPPVCTVADAPVATSLDQCAVFQGRDYRGVPLPPGLCCPDGWVQFGDGSGCHDPEDTSRYCYLYGNDFGCEDPSAEPHRCVDCPHPCPSVQRVWLTYYDLDPATSNVKTLDFSSFHRFPEWDGRNADDEVDGYTLAENPDQPGTSVRAYDSGPGRQTQFCFADAHQDECGPTSSGDLGNFGDAGANDDHAMLWLGKAVHAPGVTWDFGFRRKECGSEDFPAESCGSVREHCQQSETGWFYIDEDGPQIGNDPREMECDMTIGSTPDTAAFSCAAIRNACPGVSDGDYWIQPRGPSTLISVHCIDMATGTPSAEIGHDQEDRQHRIGCEEIGGCRVDVNYPAEMAQLAEFVSHSNACSQSLVYDCHGSGIWDSDESTSSNHAWWHDRNGVRNDDWPGSTPSQCDQNDPVWRQDAGEITGLSLLPVTAVFSGDTDDEGEEAYLTIGRLRCHSACGESPEYAAESCGAIRESCSSAPDGDYFIDPHSVGDLYQLRCGPCPEQDLLLRCRRSGRAECEADSECMLCGSECYPRSNRHDGSCGPNPQLELQDCIWSAGEQFNLLLNPNLDDGWSQSYAADIRWNDIAAPPGVIADGSPGSIGPTCNVVSFGNARSDYGPASYWYSYSNMAPMEPGRPYKVLVWTRANVDGVGIRMYTADNQEAGRVWGDFQTISRTWRLIEWSFVNPEGSEAESVSFNFDGSAVSTTPGVRIWLAAPQLVESAYPCGESEQRAVPTCSSIRRNCPAAVSGMFWIDADGVAWSNNAGSKVGGDLHEPGQQYCNMGTGHVAVTGATGHVADFGRMSCSLDDGVNIQVCLPTDSPTHDGLLTLVSTRTLTYEDFYSDSSSDDDWFVLTQQHRCQDIVVPGPLPLSTFNESFLQTRSTIFFERVLEDHPDISVGAQFTKDLVCLIDRSRLHLVEGGEQQVIYDDDDQVQLIELDYSVVAGRWDGSSISIVDDSVIPVSAQSAMRVQVSSTSTRLEVVRVYAMFTDGRTYELSGTHTNEDEQTQVCALLPIGQMIDCSDNACTIVWDTLYEYLPHQEGEYSVDVFVETAVLPTGASQHDPCQQYSGGTVVQDAGRRLQSQQLQMSHVSLSYEVTASDINDQKQVHGSVILPVDIETSAMRLADVHAAVAPKLATAFTVAGMTRNATDFTVLGVSPGSVVVQFMVQLPSVATQSNMQMASAAISNPSSVGLAPDAMATQLVVWLPGNETTPQVIDCTLSELEIVRVDTVPKSQDDDQQNPSPDGDQHRQHQQDQEHPHAPSAPTTIPLWIPILAVLVAGLVLLACCSAQRAVLCWEDPENAGKGVSSKP